MVSCVPYTTSNKYFILRVRRTQRNHQRLLTVQRRNNNEIRHGCIGTAGGLWKCQTHHTADRAERDGQGASDKFGVIPRPRRVPLAALGGVSAVFLICIAGNVAIEGIGLVKRAPGASPGSH